MRRDLGMGTGKIAAQVAHAAVMAVERTKEKKPEWFHEWFNAGQAKVVVKVQSFDELMEVRKHAESLKPASVPSKRQRPHPDTAGDDYLHRDRAGAFRAG